MCVAAPGAGKTRFSAVLAKQLIEQDLIDFVICFAPSVSVSQGIKSTFTHILNDPFDGKIGSHGQVITYQALQYKFEDLGRLVEMYRILIISDEIHHCANGAGSLANQWGSSLSSLIELGNPLTLTLSGTPWRSNSTKIALQNYSGVPELLNIDFLYGLGEAVRDKVCRKPNLIMLDNKSISIKEGDECINFESIERAIESKKLRYSDLLLLEQSLKQLLNHSHQELMNIRLKHPRAAGLVVASSVSQAKRIKYLIESEYDQTAILVSHDETNSHDLIRNFQASDMDWIVSIGMISEGTDIPRLQVCAYLSNVRTELYFRQVLGRILRVNESSDEVSSLFAFAEPRLMEFARRIASDLPEESMKIVQSELNSTYQLARDQPNANSHQPNFSEISDDKNSIRRSSGALLALSESYQTVSALFCKDSYMKVILSL